MDTDPQCGNFLAKTYAKTKELDPVGGHAPAAPPWIHQCLAQEAKKLAKNLKEEEEASQWSGMPIKKLLNQSFTEQLNYIQALQQIAPLHSTREHLPQDIITILK